MSDEVNNIICYQRGCKFNPDDVVDGLCSVCGNPLIENPNAISDVPVCTVRVVTGIENPKAISDEEDNVTKKMSEILNKHKY